MERFIQLVLPHFDRNPANMRLIVTLDTVQRLMALPLALALALALDEESRQTYQLAQALASQLFELLTDGSFEIDEQDIEGYAFIPEERVEYVNDDELTPAEAEAEAEAEADETEIQPDNIFFPCGFPANL